MVNALPDDKPIANAVRQLAECANNVADSLSELGYDHAGPLYHRILGSAKSDGAFYTNNVSALMLARLALDENFVDWSDENAVANLRIIDPACGTGTLLMAALRTIKDRMRERRDLPKDDEELMHRMLVEDVLCGLDINRHGVQLAACNLTLGAPTVDYKRMNLHTMKHGPQDEASVRAGSLEILTAAEGEGDLATLVAPLRGLSDLDGDHVAQDGEASFPLRDVDLVIMNPPFTDNRKRGRKFSKETLERMQVHELAMREHLAKRDSLAAAAITTNSISTFFTPLAEKLTKSDRATIAKVVPTTACIGAGGKTERRFLASRYQIERIVTTHDPRRINFSENTTIHESLLICRRRNARDRAPTQFVSLNRMPSNSQEAVEAAEAILDGNSDWGNRLLWPTDRIEAGDWTPAQWFDGELAQIAAQLEDEPQLQPLGQDHKLGPVRQVAQDSWKKCDAEQAATDERALRIFDTNSAKVRRTMAGDAEQWVIPGGGRRVHLWENVKRQGSTLLVAEKLNTFSGRLTAVYSDEPTFGFGWRPVETKTKEESKALCLCLNSTPARILLLNRRAKTLTYPQWSTEHWEAIQIPRAETAAMRLLVDAWEELKEEELLEMRFGETDPVRIAIDAAAARACGLSKETIAIWREKLSREPTVTNQRRV